MLTRLRKAKLASRVRDEILYEIIANEIEQGVQKKGLWLKAIANARGNEKLA